MALFVHNTLTQKKEEFKPQSAGKVKMYVCGTTPYDHCHLGHARCYVVFDVIRKYLEYFERKDLTQNWPSYKVKEKELNKTDLINREELDLILKNMI